MGQKVAPVSDKDILASAVIDDIRALMEKHGLTTADIDAHVKGKKRSLRAADKHAGNGKSRPAIGTKGKYMNQRSAAKKATAGTKKAVSAKAAAKKASAKQSAPAAVKKAPAKRGPRKSVTAPATTVESTAGSSTT